MKRKSNPKCVNKKNFLSVNFRTELEFLVESHKFVFVFGESLYITASLKCYQNFELSTLIKKPRIGIYSVFFHIFLIPIYDYLNYVNTMSVLFMHLIFIGFLILSLLNLMVILKFDQNRSVLTKKELSCDLWNWLECFKNGNIL